MRTGYAGLGVSILNKYESGQTKINKSADSTIDMYFDIKERFSACSISVLFKTLELLKPITTFHIYQHNLENNFKIIKTLTL